MQVEDSDSSDTDSHSFSSQENASPHPQQQIPNRRVRFMDQAPSSQGEEDEDDDDDEEEEEEDSSDWEDGETLSPKIPEAKIPVKKSNPLSKSPSDSENESESESDNEYNEYSAPAPPTPSVRVPLLSSTPHPQMSYRLNTPPSPVIPVNERAIDVEGLPHHPFTPTSAASTPNRNSFPRYPGQDTEFQLTPLKVSNPTTGANNSKRRSAEYTQEYPPQFGETADLLTNYRFPDDPDSKSKKEKATKGIRKKDGKTDWEALGKKIGIGVAKTVGLLYLLFMFVCSLDLLSLGFRLIGGRSAGEIFRKSDLLQNPVVGVMIGILTTVLVQSSSTSTSIIVGMVSAGFLEVPIAIPLIMGANIGTSITNTIVSFSQAGDRAQFRRAFAGATLLDMFNWITVIVLLIVEVFTGYLYHTTTAIMNGLMPNTTSGGDFQLLSRLTRPFVNLIVQLDRNVLDCWSTPNCTKHDNSSLIREYCDVRQIKVQMITTLTNSDGVLDPDSPTVITSMVNNTHKCNFLFAATPLNDKGAGAIILVVSLFILCSCLILIVKLLNSVLQGQVAVVIQKTINADIPYVGWLTGYLAILVGAVMTFLVQSSSVFTSAITPLIGLEVITVERAYPLTLGSNIGTTTTALLASMAVEGKALFPSMQIALCHLLFNVTGIVLFYPVPFLRLPIPMAKFLGKTTAKYRWFAIVYMVFMFAILPAITIGLSAFGGRIAIILFCTLIGALGLFVGIVTFIQRKRPAVLPEKMRTWKFLPAPLRSLQPYDDFFTKFTYCRKLRSKTETKKTEDIIESKPKSEAPPLLRSPPVNDKKDDEDNDDDDDAPPPFEPSLNPSPNKNGDGDIPPQKRTNSYYEYEV